MCSRVNAGYKLGFRACATWTMTGVRTDSVCTTQERRGGTGSGAAEQMPPRYLFRRAAPSAAPPEPSPLRKDWRASSGNGARSDAAATVCDLAVCRNSAGSPRVRCAAPPVRDACPANWPDGAPTSRRRRQRRWSLRN